ncbi:NADH dehydrogenase [ubiquinone] complex I, assembly factor 7 [Desmophyllum pertusum]|uniref:Protein arginine methyltransferase NDUFAF7 n=1 Tax=Desmophyllum pertusum TaxID=174260 RepID=A0A9W9YS49_9CNID|nr:NADH dehydrogenase [ubiquinone] complex I, assembly factor 7 [Desmophyllum pertusum]
MPQCNFSRNGATKLREKKGAKTLCDVSRDSRRERASSHRGQDGRPHSVGLADKTKTLYLLQIYLSSWVWVESTFVLPSSPGNVTLQKHLTSRIKASGPLTVAAFMQEVLTNPMSGYYMNSDVFGQAGDFITSPEISQVFGELVGVWFVNQWITTGKNNVQLVELGPGRGTLASDMLRVFSKFPELHSKVSLHLVEVSPALSEIQEKMLTGRLLNNQQDQEQRQDDTTDEQSWSNEVQTMNYLVY